MFRSILTVLFLAATPAAALADSAGFSFAGDSYAAGDRPSITTAVSHDAFMAGNTLSLSAPVSGSAHLAGVTVNADAPVTGNLYAGGLTVEVSGPVAGSLSVLGNTMDVKPSATIGGNVRLAGGTVTLGAPVTGSALVSARSLTLSAPIGGDLNFYGGELEFGPGAKVGGTISIHAPKAIAVPASVAPPERVQFAQLNNPDIAAQTGSGATGLVGGFGAALATNLIWWLFLFVVGAALLMLAPAAYETGRQVAGRHFWRSLGVGVLAFAAMLGLVPAAAFTIVGIILIPFILVLAVLACVLGYITGTFFLAQRIAAGLMPAEGNWPRLGVLALGLIAAGLLSLIPVLGWLISFLLTLFGIGIVVTVLFGRAGGVTGIVPVSAQPGTRPAQSWQV